MTQHPKQTTYWPTSESKVQSNNYKVFCASSAKLLMFIFRLSSPQTLYTNLNDFVITAPPELFNITIADHLNSVCVWSVACFQYFFIAMLFLSTKRQGSEQMRKKCYRSAHHTLIFFFFTWSQSAFSSVGFYDLNLPFNISSSPSSVFFCIRWHGTKRRSISLV